MWEQLREAVRPPVLYALLGGTFGNLDTGEFDFLTGMLNRMGHEDCLLLDLSLAGANWDVGTDPRANCSQYSPMFMRFLEEGIRLRLPASGPRTGGWLGCEAGIGGNAVTAVPGTKELRIYDRESNATIAFVRRYKPIALRHWLEGMRWEVVWQAPKDDKDVEDPFAMGVVLLRPSVR